MPPLTVPLVDDAAIEACIHEPGTGRVPRIKRLVSTLASLSTAKVDRKMHL
jgi:hypothetical protein